MMRSKTEVHDMLRSVQSLDPPYDAPTKVAVEETLWWVLGDTREEDAPLCLFDKGGGWT